MARRSTPDRIYAARRAAVLSRLTQEHRLSAERAEALVVAWEAEGDARGIERMTAAFWEAGTAWIEEQLGTARALARTDPGRRMRRSSKQPEPRDESGWSGCLLGPMFLLGGLLAVLLLVALVVLWSEVVERLSSGITGRIIGVLFGLAFVGFGLNVFVYATGRSTPLTGNNRAAPSKVRAVVACVFVLGGLAFIWWAVVAQDTAGGF